MSAFQDEKLFLIQGLQMRKQPLCLKYVLKKESFLSSAALTNQEYNQQSK